MAGQVKVLQFAEGVDTGAPTQVGVTATNYGSFANDAAYVADKGSAATGGDAYYNTTLNLFRGYAGGAWRSFADESSVQVFSNKSFSTAVTISDTTQSTTKDTGALIVEGGVGIEKNLNVGGNAIITGDLTINGDFTIINTSVLEVEDANVLVNNGGNQATANANVAGFTVEMSDATHARIGYDSTLASKFKAGEVGSEAEVVTTSHIQTLSNKELGNTTTFETTDSLFTLQDNGDSTKKLKFELAGISGSTTRTMTIPDSNGTLALTNNKLSVFAATTSAELAGVISDETGSGSLVFNTSPTFITTILADPGSASVPGYSFNGDPNTGIYNTADLVGISTNGSSKFTVNSTGRIAGSSGINRALATTQDTSQATTHYIESGTYSPSITSISNITSVSSPGTGYWMRVGNAVTFWGEFTATGNVATTLTQVSISVPVASGFSTNTEGCGTMWRRSTGTNIGSLDQRNSNDDMVASWILLASDAGASRTFGFQCSYFIVA